MPWSSPNTINPADVWSASLYNQYVRDNFTYVMGQRPAPDQHFIKTSNYTTTATAFADTDATNHIITATINSGRFRVLCSGYWGIGNNTDRIYADIILDSLTRGGDVNLGSVNWYGNSGTSLGAVPQPFFMVVSFTGLSVGSHTFKLQWKASSSAGYGNAPAAAVTLYNTISQLALVGQEY